MSERGQNTSNVSDFEQAATSDFKRTATPSDFEPVTTSSDFWAATSSDLEPTASYSDSAAAAIPFAPAEKLSPLRSYFKLLRQILLEHKLYFIGMCIFFFASVVFGYFFSLSQPEFIQMIIENFEHFGDKTPFDFFITIFLNNAYVTCLLVLLGFFFGIMPLIIIFFNGMMIGAVFEYALKEAGLLFFLVGITPHGIIEIPILLLAGAVGFRFGGRTLLLLFGKVSLPSLKKDFFNSLWILFLFLIPMLLAAAFIEVYITGYLLELLF